MNWAKWDRASGPLILATVGIFAGMMAGVALRSYILSADIGALFAFLATRWYFTRP